MLEKRGAQVFKMTLRRYRNRDQNCGGKSLNISIVLLDKNGQTPTKLSIDQTHRTIPTGVPPNASEELLIN